MIAPFASAVVADLHEMALDDPDLPAAGAERRERIAALARVRCPLAADGSIDAAVDAVVARLDGLGELEPILADESVTDLLVGADGMIWVDDCDGLRPTGTHLDDASRDRVLQRIVAGSGRRLDRGAPILDTRLPDGSRVNVAVAPVAIDGPIISIRRFRTASIGLDEFADSTVARRLAELVEHHRNVLVTGATGAGKTTLLNALLQRAHPHERIVTVEDAAELRIGQPHVVRLQTRPATADGLAEIDQRALLRAALRMRPDRVVIGEIRGKEAFDLVQAMLTGHDGSLATCHGRSAADGLLRLESMMMMSGVGLPLESVRSQIVAAVDAVVHVERDDDGRRQVREIVGVGARRGGWHLEPLEDIAW